MKELNNTNTLYDVFKLFCSDNKLRPVMNEPFELDDKVYATDAFTLIRCDKTDCNFEINNPHIPPKADSVVPKRNMNIAVNISKETFKEYFTADEHELIGEDIECKTCGGHGEVEWEFGIHTKEDECPVCDGSGFEAEQMPKKTGRKTIGNHAVKIGNSLFDMKLFYRLIQVQSVLGGDVVLLHQSLPKAPHLFKIGFCEIILMPITELGDTEKMLVIDLNT